MWTHIDDAVECHDVGGSNPFSKLNEVTVLIADSAAEASTLAFFSRRL
jgi:hypothetical protein